MVRGKERMILVPGVQNLFCIIMRIEKLGGTEERLYQLVAPLVMKPSILRQNNNYPYKTSGHHIWFVALEDEVVAGFIPVELKDRCATVNNYYIAGDDPHILTFMLQEVVCDFAREYKLQSVTHTRHLAIFQAIGFLVVRTWKLYMKMEYRQS